MLRVIAGLLVLFAADAACAVETPPPLAGAQVVQVTLPSRDLARSLAFYRDRLGLRLLFTTPDAAFFEAGAVRLRLERSAAAPARGATVYFDDPGLARAEALRRKGVIFAGPPEVVQHTAQGDLELAEFEDPDGNGLAMMGLVARAAAR